MTTISVDIMPVLSALRENSAAAVFAGAEPVAVPQPSKEAVEAFQVAMGSLVAENREVQVALEKVVPLPLDVAAPVVAAPVTAERSETAEGRETPTVRDVAAPEAKPVVVAKPLVEITPEIVKQFAEVIAPLVTENREAQVALEKVAPLPLDVALPETKPVVTAKPMVEVTPEIVKQFAEVIAPLVTENREVQVALEKVAPLPLEVATPVVGTTPVVPSPVAETATVRDVAAPEMKPVALEATPVVAAKPLVEITPEIVRQFAEVIAPLVTENREVQVALEKVAPLPLDVAAPEAKPVVSAKPLVEITPEIVKQFAEVIAPLVAENREVQVALEKVAPLPLEVATPVVGTTPVDPSPVAETATVRDVAAPEMKPVALEATPVVAAKPLVEITPEIVRQFAEVIAPLVTENREVQGALEKAAPLPLEMATPVVGTMPVVPTPVAETATVRDVAAPESKPVALEAKPVVTAKPLVEITPEIVREFAEVIAPLVTENREVQVALEKVAPLPLEVATVRDVSAPVTAERSETAEGRETPTVREVVALEAKPVVVAKPLAEITPEIVKQFAEVIAPLVTENREVQVALEKVAPLPLEVATPVVAAPVVPTPVAETATVRDVAAPVAETATVRKEKAPASELPDAGMVMQATPIMPQPQIDISVRPVAAPAAVDGVSAAVAAQRTAPTPSEVLVAAAEAVADTIMVTPGLLTGEGQIRVQLRPDVLDGTEIQINVTGRAIAVDFLPQTTDMATLIQRCLPQLEQHLASRIHSFKIVATVGATRRRKA